MRRVLLSASFSEELLLRQTPGGRGQWGDVQYLTQPDGAPVSGWVVYDNLRSPIAQACSPENTLLITGEPECLRRYRPRFAGQFEQVLTSHRSLQHPRVIRHHEAQHWHYALYPGPVHGKQLLFDELRDLPCPRKDRNLSVICSSKADSEDHRRRLEFARLLKQVFGDDIDLFGRDIRTMADKSEAIFDYKYHIVLENDHSEHFMTEKLADAFLGWSYPIYFGGPEARRLFPEGSFTPIDIYRPHQALAIIRDVLRRNTFEQARPKIAAARELVLTKQNLFAVLAEFWRQRSSESAPRPIRLLPKNHRTRLVLKHALRGISGAYRRRAA